MLCSALLPFWTTCRHLLPLLCTTILHPLLVSQKAIMSTTAPAPAAADEDEDNDDDQRLRRLRIRYPFLFYLQAFWKELADHPIRAAKYLDERRDKNGIFVPLETEDQDFAQRYMVHFPKEFARKNLIRQFARYGFEKYQTGEGDELKEYFFHPLWDYQNPDWEGVAASKAKSSDLEKQQRAMVEPSKKRKKKTKPPKKPLVQVHQLSQAHMKSKEVQELMGWDTSEMEESEDDDEEEDGDAQESDDDEESMTESKTEEEAPRTPARFAVRQRVLCKDHDGLIYEAIIRRSLWGPHNQKQIQVGMAVTDEDFMKLQEKAVIPQWHYFVHFLKWKVQWDRWVAEEDVLELIPEHIEWQKVVAKAHKSLSQQMQQQQKHKQKISSKTKKKLYQCVDGADFLRSWRKRLEELEAERARGVTPAVLLGIEELYNNKTLATEKKASADSKKKAASVEPLAPVWTKAQAEKEAKLRNKAMTTIMDSTKGGRRRTPISRMVLPFSLKKILVEDWEIITQCHMVPVLPARITIQDALNLYLRTKGVVRLTNQEKGGIDQPDGTSTLTPEVAVLSKMIGPRQNNSTVDASSDETDEALVVRQRADGRWIVATVNSSADENSEHVASFGSREEASLSMQMWVELRKSRSKQGQKDEAGDEEDDRDKEWIDMVDGIAQFFDEGLAFRLLYKHEIPQHKVLSDHPELGTVPKTELYGCEHLLRLFMCIPELLNDQLRRSNNDSGGNMEEDFKRIMAKVNDLTRFLHKYQTMLFHGSHRKLNDAEIKEAEKMEKSKERARKRRLEAQMRGSGKVVGEEGAEPEAKRTRVE